MQFKCISRVDKRLISHRLRKLIDTDIFCLLTVINCLNLYVAMLHVCAARSVFTQKPIGALGKKVNHTLDCIFKLYSLHVYGEFKGVACIDANDASHPFRN